MLKKTKTFLVPGVSVPPPCPRFAQRQNPLALRHWQTPSEEQLGRERGHSESSLQEGEGGEEGVLRGGASAGLLRGDSLGESAPVSEPRSGVRRPARGGPISGEP